MSRPARWTRSLLAAPLLVTGLASPGKGGAQATDAPGITIEYIAHASFRIRSVEGHTVIIDPYASRVWLGYDFPSPFRASTVVITHPHYDHDGGRYRGLDVPWGPEVEVIDGPGRYTIGDIVIQGIEGKHADPYGKEFGQLNTIFILETAGIRVAHVGDNGPLTQENIRAMGSIDVLMMPIDGVFHILAEDEVEAVIDGVGARVVVPMHYRIPELETDPESPSDLGPIGPWLQGRDGVARLDTNTYRLSRQDLAGAPKILVFRHSPDVPEPDEVPMPDDELVPDDEGEKP